MLWHEFVCRIRKSALLVLLLSRTSTAAPTAASSPTRNRWITAFGASRVALIAPQTMTVRQTSQEIIIHWFRMGDLRLHDNPALLHSLSFQGAIVVPLFCFDTTKIFGNTARNSHMDDKNDSSTCLGIKCSPRRAQFVVECVRDLKSNLRKQKSDLIVLYGDPVQQIDQFIKSVKDFVDPELASSTTASPHAPVISKIVCQEEMLQEERDTEIAVVAVLQKHFPKAKLQTVWGSTMYDLADLPFKKSTGAVHQQLSDMPDTFTPFRNKVEKSCKIKPPSPVPEDLKFPARGTVEFEAIYQTGKLDTMVPSLADLGYAAEQTQKKYAIEPDPRGVMKFEGGESHGLARVKKFIWDDDCLKNYFDTRNGMIGAAYSSKFSTWLAHGCISPRHVAQECAKYEASRVANKSTYGWYVQANFVLRTTSQTHLFFYYMNRLRYSNCCGGTTASSSVSNMVTQSSIQAAQRA
jgi:deoxyribodipyrimidine photo-lyase